MKLPLKRASRATHHLPQGRHDHQAHRSFEDVMTDATHAMPKYQRYFSRFIHLGMVWSASEALSKTIARPNAILFGAILSFAITAGVYVLSKNFGYSLSGFESIGAFLVGWTVGVLFDLLSSLFRRKK